MHYALAVLIAAASASAQTVEPSGSAADRLSAGQEADLLAGRGMGLAKAAELNGWPGPSHVLELAERLDLTLDQRSATEALFRRMGDQARALGIELVTAERALVAGFRDRTIDADALAATTARIGALQGAVREVHLAAHLKQTALLTEAQVVTYNRLRGNAAAAADDVAPGHRHGN